MSALLATFLIFIYIPAFFLVGLLPQFC